jgi:hypothetical protein
LFLGVKSRHVLLMCVLCVCVCVCVCMSVLLCLHGCGCLLFVVCCLLFVVCCLTPLRTVIDHCSVRDFSSVCEFLAFWLVGGGKDAMIFDIR